MVKYVYLKPDVQISKASEEEKKKSEISRPKNLKDKMSGSANTGDIKTRTLIVQ